MPKVTVTLGLTLNTGNFNNFKPEIGFEVDTDKDIEEQLKACIDATRQVTQTIASEMENLLDREGMKEFESTAAGMKKSLELLERRVGKIEGNWDNELVGIIGDEMSQREQDISYDAGR